MTRPRPRLVPPSFALALAVSACAATAVLAQTSPNPTPPPDAQSADLGLRPLCSDRPTQSASPCTVDKGYFQLESDIFNGTYDRAGGSIVDTYLFTNPTLKYGLTNTSDIEVAITPYEEVRTHDPATGATDALYGVGDFYLRYKQNLFGEATGSTLSLAVEPFVKAPTARRGIGDGAWEGGLLVPFNAKLSQTLALTLNGEVEVVKNIEDAGVHPSQFETICLTWQATSRLSAYLEAYAKEDQDPSGATTQTTGDVALSYTLTYNLQFDAGVNIGLNDQAAAFQGYVGVTQRF